MDRVLFRIQCVSVQKLRQILFSFFVHMKITLFETLLIVLENTRLKNRKKAILRD